MSPLVSASKKLERVQLPFHGEQECARCELHEHRGKVVIAEGLPDADIMFIGEAPGCFPAGTPVSTPYGAKPIESLRAGDCVYSQTGYTQRVIRTFTRQSDEALIRLKLRGGHEIKCTLKHPFLVLELQDCTYGGLNHFRNGCLPCSVSQRCPHKYYESYEPKWKHAESIQKGNYLLIPRRHTQRREQTVDLKSFLRTRVGDTVPYRRTLGDRSIRITPRAAYYMGWYMAEGTTGLTSGTVTLNCGIADKQWLHTILEAAEELFLEKPRVKQTENTLLISVSDRIWARAFSAWFGGHSYLKRVPEFIASSPKEVIASFVLGWYRGDGKHLVVSKPDGIVTTSETAKDQLVELLLTLGLVPTVSVEEPRLSSSGIQGRHAIWTIKFRKGSASPEDSTIGFDIPRGYALFGDYFAVRVDSVDVLAPASVEVYNLETEDNTYGVPFVAHNSSEDKYGHPFYGQAGNNLDLLLAYAKVPRSRVIVANTLNCAPWNFQEKLVVKGDESTGWRIGKPKQKQIDQCSYWLDQRILQSNVRLVIPLGNYSLKKFMPKTSVGKVHGMVFEVEFTTERDDLPEDCPKSKMLLVMPQYHPAAPLHNPDLKLILAQDYEKIPNAISMLPGRPPIENYKLALTWDDITSIDREIRARKLFAFDYETTGSDATTDLIIGMSISTQEGTSSYIPMFDQYFDRNRIMRWFTRYLSDPDYEVIAHRLAFEYKFTAPFTARFLPGKPVVTNYHDTAIEWYALGAESNALKEMALRILNIQMTKIETFIGTGKKQTTMLDASRKDLYAVAMYGAADSDMTLRLHNKAMEKFNDS